MGTWLLDEDDVIRVVRAVGRDELMDRVIERLATGLAQVGVGQRPSSPARSGLVRDEPGGVIEWMPHHEPGDSVTIKTVAYSPHNPWQFQLPTIIGTLARFDDATGRLVALVDGVLLTAVRTGAASAVASRLLARPDSTVAGLVGTGAQAVTQLHALTRVLPLERVLVHDINPRHAASFANRVAFLGLEVNEVSAEQVAALTDVISTATSVGVGAGPVLPDVGVQEHLHVNAVGSDLAGKTELSKGLLRRAFVCPDHPEQARLEGECQQILDCPVGPSLPELCADPRIAMAHRSGTTVFDSTGFALEDHLALDVFLELAGELGLGTRLLIEHHPQDVLDPYSLRPSPVRAAGAEAAEVPGGDSVAGRNHTVTGWCT